jgi:predicted glycosyltransferase
VILYYALGGGLGHLTRARKVLEALELTRDAVLLTASPFGADPRVTGGIPVLKVPRRLGHDRDAFRAWLAPVLRQADALIVDSFPAGILGELSGMTLPPARHVARLLRWDAYATRLDGPLPDYDVIYALEPLTHDLGPTLPLHLPATPIGAPLVEEPHWLVVHSGPQSELDELLIHAEGAPKLVVVSPRHTDVYPVAPHLAHAERVITGAGFNAVHENARWRERHTLVPFPRALDDQFARAEKVLRQKLT